MSGGDGMKQVRGALPMAGVYVVTVCAMLLGIFSGNRAVTVISQRLPMEGRRCIVIDPGHGGEDGGAVSCTGKPESGYNLEISLRLRDVLNLLGYDTRMIRTMDISVYTSGDTLSQKKLSDLKERVRIVSEAQADLLVSIHQNQFTDSRYSGPQVFYAATEGSRSAAETMQTALVAALAPNCNRQCKKAQNVYLMERISCTGILIECGFLSNPEEESKLANPSYQKHLVCVIAATIAEIYSNT